MTTSNTLTAAETEARAMIASAAWASGHFALDVDVPELVRSGASPSEIVSRTWSVMTTKLDAAFALTRIGPHYGGAA